ncbi:putative 7-carboxy-7-deazaguanine synthase QueE [uncultured Dialister sp.]|uniref:putative 7-carboxy-7-deazaguanine synthase QueE n=1 Tax=uncultured Dialister sp. TaxID=278064 RepID=UPI0025FEFD24|nr:putative 7-carboxy-7-deazaguanine synthase QueE [uncultured Dialister sp.]
MKSKYAYDDGLFHVTEIFDSIDGEGKRTGYMAVFLRLAGCNLRCSYCDTAYSLTLEDTEEALTEEEVLSRIRAYPWKRVTITGGEPMLHPLHHLCEVLGEEGYDINIETNGAVPLWRERPEGVFYTMDFKCSGSGMKSYMNLDNFKLLTGKDVLKFVVSSEEDLHEMKEIVNHRFSSAHHPEFFVSPVWGRIEPAELVEYVRKNRLQDVRVQVQLHKIIWDPDRRGV